MDSSVDSRCTRSTTTRSSYVRGACVCPRPRCCHAYTCLDMRVRTYCDRAIETYAAQLLERIPSLNIYVLLLKVNT